MLIYSTDPSIMLVYCTISLTCWKMTLELESWVSGSLQSSQPESRPEVELNLLTLQAVKD